MGRSEPVLPASARLLHGYIWMLGGRLAGMVVALGTSIVLARLLTPSRFGIYFLAVTTTGFAAMAAQIGMNEAAVRLTAESLGRGDPGRARASIRLAFLVGSLGAGVVCGILALGGWRYLAIHIFHSLLLLAILPWAIAWVVILVFQSILGGVFRGLQQMKLAMIFDGLIASCLTFIALIALWLTRSDTRLSIVVGITVVTSVVAAAIGILKLLPSVRTLVGVGTVTLAGVVSVGWPLLLIGAAGTLIGSTSDLWVLAAFRPASEVALYGGALRLAAALSLPFVALCVSIAPIMAEMTARDKTGQLERLIQSSTAVAALPAILALLALPVFSRSILVAIYGPFYARGAPVLLVLSAAQCVLILTGPAGYALFMGGHQRAALVPVLVGGAFAISGDILAAPRFGAIGIAVVSSVVLATQNVVVMIVARRRLGYWTFARISRGDLQRMLRSLRERISA